MNCNHFDKLVGLQNTSYICGALLFDDDIMHSARKIIMHIIVCDILAMLGSRCSVQSDRFSLIIFRSKSLFAHIDSMRCIYEPLGI